MIPRVSYKENKRGLDDRMSKVLSIELGYSLTRVCEIDYKTKKPKIYANFEFKTPENVLEDGFVKQPEEMGNALRAAIEHNGIKTKQVVFTISSARIASRDTTLPFVKENKLEELVHASASDVFPVDISNCKLTYQILETQESEGNDKKYHVALYAAPNDLLESYYTMCTIAGLTIEALDYSSNSFAVATRGIFMNGSYMAVKVDDRSSLVSVFKDGSIALQRTVPYGGDAAIDEIINLEEQESGERVTYEKALGLLQMRSCIRASIDASVEDDEDGGDDRIKQFRMNIAETFGMFNSSIMRVIDYYNSRNTDNPVEKIYITGYAETFLGLNKLMSNELGVPVERLGDRSIEIFSGLKEGGPYINCIGAAIEPMDFIPDKHNSKKKRSLKKGGAGAARIKKEGSANVEPNFLLYGILVFVVCAIGAGALAAMTLMPYWEEEKKNKQLTQREAELEPVQEVYWNKVYAEEYYNQTAVMEGITTTPNENLPAFFEELEEKLPSTVNMISFVVDDTTVTMNMNLESKEAAAMVVEQLRTFDSLLTVDARVLTEEINEVGGSVVNMSAICTYAPYVPQNNDTPAEDDETPSSEDESPSEESEHTEEEVQEGNE